MSGINLNNLHESESFSILLDSPSKLDAIYKILKSLGGVPYDDFIEFPRLDAVQSWQSSNIANVTLLSNETPLEYYYGDDEEEIDNFYCDQIQLQILMASVSDEAIDLFIKLVGFLQELTTGCITHREQQVNLDEVQPIFSKYRQDIALELDEKPGSKLLVITIAESYPR